MIIYKIRNKVTDLIYIGATTKSLEQRFIDHMYAAKYRKNKLYDAFKEYGIENFVPEIIMVCKDKEELNNMEIHYIKLYDTIKNGYNGCAGGLKLNAKGYTHTEEWKKNRSKDLLGHKHGFKEGDKVRLGKKHSDETKEKISESQKGRKLPEETKEKIRKVNTGNANIGQYKCVDPNGKVYITTNGLTQFCKEHNLTNSLMAKVARGERTHHKNWSCEKSNGNK